MWVVAFPTNHTTGEVDSVVDVVVFEREEVLCVAQVGGHVLDLILEVFAAITVFPPNSSTLMRVNTRRPNQTTLPHKARAILIKEANVHVQTVDAPVAICGDFITNFGTCELFSVDRTISSSATLSIEGSTPSRPSSSSLPSRCAIRIALFSFAATINIRR